MPYPYSDDGDPFIRKNWVALIALGIAILALLVK